MRKDIAKITDTFLGYEDHGVFTAMIFVDYGGGSAQGVGGHALDTPAAEGDPFRNRRGTAYGMEFIARTIRACGVARWEQIKGRTIYVLQDLPEGASALGTSNVVGIENLPTEPGERFLFMDLMEQFAEPNRERSR